jgi:MFS family permease
VYGTVNQCLPVTFPIFRRLFHASLEQLGRSQLLFFIAGLCFSLIGGWFVDRLGLKLAAIVTLFCSSFSVALIGAVGSFRLVLGDAFLFGLSMAALIVVYSAITCECYPEKRQSVFLISGVMGSVGGVLGPAVQGKWLVHAERTGASWGTAYFVGAALLGTLIVWAILLRRGVLPKRESKGGGVLGAVSAMKGLLGRPALHAIGLAYILHAIAQQGMISWIGQVFQSRHPINSAQTAYFISFYLGGVFAGRSTLSWITARWKIPDLLLLSVCASATTLAYVATLLSGSYVGGMIGFTIAGFFASGNGPAISSYIGLRFSDQTATAFALLGGISNIGSAGGGYLIGFLAARFGLEIGIWLMPIFMLAVAIFAFGWFWRSDERYRTAPC